MHFLGIDVGGTKVEIAAVEGGAAIEPQQVPTPLDSTDALLDAIEALAREVIAAQGQPTAIGVGVPSQIDFATGQVVSSVNIPLEGVPLRDELQSRFGVPVYVDNDANCAALAEAQLVDDGPARQLVMLTLGTGVGGGVVIDGKVFRGATGLGAELGHMVVDANGRKCPGRTCPNTGCLEGYCSGTALERAAGKKGRQVVDDARAGDAEAIAHMTELGKWLGVGISNFVNIFEPEHVVIGGGLGAAADLYLDEAVREAGKRALPAGFERLTISLAKGGGDAGVIGAGLLAANEYALHTDEGDTAPSPTFEGGR
jgi:glucokinase